MVKKTYFKIAQDLDFFDSLIKLRKSTTFSGTGNLKRLTKFIDEISVNSKILPMERKKHFEEQILEGLNSDYGKDIANIKCKQFLFEVGLSILSDLRSCIGDYNIQYAIAFNKKKEINMIVEKLGVQLKEINKTKTIYNNSLDNKIKLMECSRVELSRLNNGEFFLNNSVVSLLNTLGRTAESLFLETDINIGANTLHNFGINHVCQRLKYYVDKSEIDKFNNEEPLIQFDIEKVKASLEELKHFTNGSEENIKEYIKKANVTDLNSTPDEPNSVANAWVDCTNKLVSALGRCYTNTDIIIGRIKDLGDIKLTPIEDMINNLEEVYKSLETDDGNTEANEKLVKDYQQLISIGVVSYNFFLEFNAYDIQTYLIDLNFLAFYSNLLNDLCQVYLKTMNELFLDQMYRIKAEKERMIQEQKQQQAQQQQQQQNAVNDKTQIQNANVNNQVNNNNQPQQPAQQQQGEVAQTTAQDGTVVNVPANQVQQ